MTAKGYISVDLRTYFSQHQKAQVSVIEGIIERIPLIKRTHEMKAEWCRCLTDTMYTPRYFFHGTTMDRWENIKHEGLNPEKGILGRIYLATSYTDAEKWAKVKSCQRKSKPVTLYVDSTLVPEMNVVRRDNSTFRCLSIIPPEHIKKMGPVLEFLLK